MWLFSALAPALYKGCGTNSWLHDTESHKNFAPDFLLKVFMFNMQEIWSFDSQKSY